MIIKGLAYFKFRRPLIVYPWMIIVLFILKKFDIFELHPAWSDILIFLIMNFVVLLFAFKILNIFIKDRLKTWLVVSLVLIILLNYYDLNDYLSQWSIFHKTLNSLPFLLRRLLNLSPFILLIFAVLKFKRVHLKISKYLNVLLIALIIYQLYAIFSQDKNSITLTDKIEIKENNLLYLNNKPPDIYYIVLDAYTSNQSLKDYWDYSNDELTNFLKTKGFILTTDSKTNYNLTIYSLCSSLNMSYLANVPRIRNENLAYVKNLRKLIEDSQLIKYLVKNGYRVINYSFFDLPKTPRYYSDFYFVKRCISDGTAQSAVLRHLNIKWDDENYNDSLLTLQTINPEILSKAARLDKNHEKPNFVYAHVMMPHDPYLFDEFGEIHEDDSVFVSSLKDRYLGQLKYLNKLLINAIKEIFDNNPQVPPVIIIGGDHGYRFLSGNDKRKESMTILNAYYFPDHDYSKIYNSISPVNTFRVVLNKYLNAELPILKDTSYNVFNLWVNSSVNSLPKTASARK